jgi:hypothetical protein
MRVKTLGNITAVVEYKNGIKNFHYFPNIALSKGKEVLANFLVNQPDKVYVKNMIFGDGGRDDNIKRTVDVSRNSLFGITRVNKPVVAQIDPLVPTQAIFTAVITREEANGYLLNEMALQLNTENLFSMATFAGFNKTEEIQINFKWVISFI